MGLNIIQSKASNAHSHQSNSVTRYALPACDTEISGLPHRATPENTNDYNFLNYTLACPAYRCPIPCCTSIKATGQDCPIVNCYESDKTSRPWFLQVNPDPATGGYTCEKGNPTYANTRTCDCDNENSNKLLCTDPGGSRSFINLFLFYSIVENSI